MHGGSHLPFQRWCHMASSLVRKMRKDAVGAVAWGWGYVRLFLGMTWRDPVGVRRSEVLGTFFFLFFFSL